MNQVLRELRELECPVVLLGGGNPFVVEPMSAEVVRFAAELGFVKTYLVTNGTELSDSLLAKLAQYHVHLIIQVYSHQPSVHDAITRQDGSFRELHINLERIRAAGLSLSFFTLVVMDVNQDTLADTVAHYQAFSPDKLFTDYLYPGTDGDMQGVPMALADKLVIKQANRRMVNLHSFFDQREFHLCLYGKLAITADGFLLPCPAMPDYEVGDVQTHSLQALLADRRLDRYWRLTKDKVASCQECEFRYACFDCRALHARASGDLHGLVYCMYNPSTGVWGDDCARQVIASARREADERSCAASQRPQ